MRNRMLWLWHNEEAQDLIEYGLLIALVALAAIASMSTLASSVNQVFNTLASTLTSAITH